MHARVRLGVSMPGKPHSTGSWSRPGGLRWFTLIEQSRGPEVKPRYLI